MINFRYHLVSLVSVFLALAVGIVLGAGPLKEPINTGLDEQVVELRGDKDALREEAAAAEAGSEYRDKVISGLVSAGVEGLLDGRRVALVSVGGGSEEIAEAIDHALDDAGATVSARVTVERSWWDTSNAELAEVAREVRRLAPEDVVGLGPEATAGAGASEEPTGAAGAAVAAASGALAAGLAYALVPLRREGSTLGARAVLPLAARPLLACLEEAGLIAADSPTEPADAVVVVIGRSLARAGAEAEDGWERQDGAVLGLLREMARLAPAAVIVGQAESEREILAQARADEAVASGASTVDGDSSPAVVILAVRAASAGIRGVRGAYGPAAAEGGGQALPPRLPAPTADSEPTTAVPARNRAGGGTGGMPAP